MSTLWTDRYFPHNFDEFIGNVEALEFAKKWASEWDKGKASRPLLFYGPTGTGKTCLAILIAKQFGWDLFELNAGDFRNKEVIERLVGVASQGASFSGKKRLILLDEVDGLQAEDKGGAAAIVKILKESCNPLILTANDIYARQQLTPIRENCKMLQFKRINYLSIASRLREILEKEGIPFDNESLKELARNCKGDFRSALLDTQTLAFSGKIDAESVKALGYRERQENIFKVLDVIFKAKTVEEVRKARFQSEVSDDLLFRWVEENIPNAYGNAEDIANAFDVLSRADIFEGRIYNRQHYGFRRYSSELFSCGVAMAKHEQPHGWLRLQFPQILKRLSSTSSSRSLKKGLAGKIGGRMHSSSRAVIAEDLPFMKMLFQDKEQAAKLSAEFGLDEKEIAFLLDAKPDSKKVIGILEKAQQLRQLEIAAKRKPLQAVDENTLKKFEEAEVPGETQEQPVHEGSEEQQNQTKLF